jgi:hypothetical protein
MPNSPKYLVVKLLRLKLNQSISTLIEAAISVNRINDTLLASSQATVVALV